MAQTAAIPSLQPAKKSSRDIGFALGIIAILCIFFLPIPAFMIDMGLAFSIALSVLILMVSLWIEKPLEFSAFPTILLVATMLRLALNIATTRLILTHGATGVTAAGYIIGGFARMVMGGDFVIGLVVFIILITVNFLVITKGATRIAEVGARFTLDAIPGKQMAIDADLSAGLINDKEAQLRRRELEEESSFFGSMDGASKFVRGDAIAGLIILAVNVFGGIVIGVTRHALDLGAAADVYTKLSVGDGLVSQIPALIVSLAAGLLVSKGGTRGAANKAVLGQLGNHPRALFVASGLLFVLGLTPMLPFFPFASISGLLAFLGHSIPKAIEKEREAKAAVERQGGGSAAGGEEFGQGIAAHQRSGTRLGKQLAAKMLLSQNELSTRVARMRRKFATQYGFVVPEIKVSDSLTAPAKSYQFKIHGAIVATQDVRIGEYLIINGDGRRPDTPGEETREPAFGMKAYSISETFVNEAKRCGFNPIDNMSVLLTHLSEVIRNNLAQLLSYKDMRALFDRLGPEYKRLLDEISPSQISYSGLQAVLKLLLAERISIRNLHLILEAIAEIAPHARRAEQIAEHVRRAHGAADLRRSRPGRRAEDPAPRQPLGPGVPPEPQARRQGRRGGVRHRPAAGRGVRRRGVGRHPPPHGRGRTFRDRRGAGIARLCAHDRRTPVRDPAGAVASRTGARRRDQVAGNDFVTLLSSDMVASVFVLFCRIGGCLMIAPGFSSPRLPVRRACSSPWRSTLALAPLLTGGKAFAIPNLGALAGDIFGELAIGGMIGLLGRLYFFALETMMTEASMNIGLSNALGAPIDEAESLPTIATFITLTTTCLIFISGLHWELIRGIVASYGVMPVGAVLRPQLALHLVADDLSRTFLIALRIASPFIVYAILVNLAIGLVNRLTPQIPAFFISGPFVIAGGLVLFYFISGPMVTVFMAEFADWAVKGN